MMHEKNLKMIGKDLIVIKKANNILSTLTKGIVHIF